MQNRMNNKSIMNKYLILLFVICLMNSCANAQNETNVTPPSTDEVEVPSGKEIYIPYD